jgi:hypothetical protein
MGISSSLQTSSTTTAVTTQVPLSPTTTRGVEDDVGIFALIRSAVSVSSLSHGDRADRLSLA